MAGDAAKAGTFKISESSSLSESDSESLTNTGKSKKEKSFWSSHSSMIRSKLGTWEVVAFSWEPEVACSHEGVLNKDLFAEGPLDFPSLLWFGQDSVGWNK